MKSVASIPIKEWSLLASVWNLFSLLFLTSLPASVQAADSSKILGPQKCAACHALEYQVWQKTHHAKAFDVLHRLPRAKEIAERMGGSKIKNNGDCLSCHYTSQTIQNSITAIAGVSCESCHGGSKEWLPLHHQKAHQMEAEEAGWIRPKNLYATYENCYECHTVPHEKLVNEGSHPPGSPFELVSWSQGQIRHNFYDAKTNPESSLPKRRILYILGKVLDLEYGLRGVAKATQNDTYGQKMALRIKAASDDLEKVKKLAPLSEINAMLTAVPRKTDGISLDIRLKQSSVYSTAADTVKAAVQKLIATQDGSRLAVIDPLIPKEYLGSPSL